MKHLVKFIATGVYTGYFPVVAGTFGTIPAWLMAWYFLGQGWLLIGAAIVTTLVSVWAAGEAESFLGHDSKKIVIDEWAGMFISQVPPAYAALSPSCVRPESASTGG